MTDFPWYPQIDGCRECGATEPDDCTCRAPTERLRRVERRGRQWWIVYVALDEGMDLETGPFLTAIGARLHLKVWG